MKILSVLISTPVPAGGTLLSDPTMDMSVANTPSARFNKELNKHNEQVALAKLLNSEVILIGDSLIAGLSRYKTVWKKYFLSRNVANFSIGGDRTQHVLWRSKNLKNFNLGPRSLS